ncbi:zinc finger BED domain-containing protein RICESLEEPER 2-like [Lycium barbarum]|uniref:zinc finger BED domain-containing protein RICESLEEPER 2-like n=1 Tax=Lycium barbarum TaxID=112863 RepID=UPI00293E0AED|nr:zinc finger BED domain-containing protein RICESLEEPER 2-like [Lycium barbarum]
MAEIEAIIDESGGSNEITAISGTDSKGKKSIMERSVVWDHFEKICGPNRELTVKCEDITCVISKCLLDWSLEKVITVTVDNASSNDVAVKEWSKQFSKWGTNMMEDGLKEVGDSVKRVRQVVRYIRQSPTRLNKFKECCELEKTICKKSLCLDVPTRWNSTYLMLKVAQEFEDVFVSYGALDRVLLHYLLTHVCSIDWENIRHMLHYVLKALIESEDSDLSSMATNMKKKFDKYCGEPEKMNKMIFTACILDPRYKDEYVTYALVSMYGEEKGEKIIGDVKKYMISLFNEYAKQHTKKSQSSSSSSVSSSGKTLDLPSQFKKHKVESGSSDAKTELDKYLGEASENGSEGTDILPWLKVNSPRFPILAEMARDVLAIPISSVASESAFSTGGHILDSFRSSLTPKLVQALVCSQDWIREGSCSVGVGED